MLVFSLHVHVSVLTISLLAYLSKRFSRFDEWPGKFKT